MKKKKQTLNGWLKGELKNKEFRKAFDAEDIRARMALMIAERRQNLHVSQAELARRVHTKQQVISDIETLRHPNITILTLDRIARALNSDLRISLRPIH
ncbi:MAG: helix-turn-helix transcriptional regulator [Elusimicrobia bacterium]|nr:helix-turn-helix transcriptional regulator [Elusimicrobiota bacterium]